MIFIGLTGNIGSGKTTVAAIFKDLGAVILDADKMARKVVVSGQKAYQLILEHFGSEILGKDLEIERQKLADIVFKNKKELAVLNRITHREILTLRKEKLAEIFESDPQALVINDIPLIFETNIEKNFQAIIVVSIDKSLQISRLHQQRGLEFEDIEARINNQMGQEIKVKRADWVISNSGTVEDTKIQVREIFNHCVNLPHLAISDIVDRSF